MTKKEHTTITELFQVLDLLESLDMQFWLDGGWGVDVLYGQQTRCLLYTSDAADE